MRRFPTPAMLLADANDGVQDSQQSAAAFRQYFVANARHRRELEGTRER
jgi:hypothetical protein